MLEAKTQCESPKSQAILELFQSHGLRYTQKRAAIYQTLASMDTHPTAHELLAAVKINESKISLATVYNTLESLSTSRLCRKIPNTSGSGPSRYDADVGPHVHVLVSDGRVMDVPHDLSLRILADLSPDTLGELENRLSIKVTEIDLKIIADAVKD
jgi:Fur family transcriptional regulator, ferric uptake regulator